MDDQSFEPQSRAVDALPSQDQFDHLDQETVEAAEDEIKDLIPEIWAEHHGVRQAVVNALAAHLIHEALLCATLRRPMAHAYATAMVQQFGRDKKASTHRDLKRGWNIPATTGLGQVAKRRHQGTLYDYPFPYLGKPLGGATWDELDAAIGKLKTRSQHDRALIKAGAELLKRRKSVARPGAVPLADLQALFAKHEVTW